MTGPLAIQTFDGAEDGRRYAAGSRVAVWLVTSALSLGCWMVLEILGGLAFLAGGVRLWTYEVMPVFSAISSPVIWLVIFIGMTPFMVAFGRFEALVQWGGGRKAAARAAYLMLMGPAIEVFINELVFRALLGRPLYVYELLPFAAGSGSFLSPLYYLTLYVHYPVTGFALARLATRTAARSAGAHREGWRGLVAENHEG